MAVNYDAFGPHLSKVKIPGAHDKIYKDECVFTFDNPVNLLGYTHQATK